MLKNRCDIRKMCKEDISCVQEIEHSLFSRPWSQQAFLQAMEQDTLYLVALEDNRVAGYCHVCIAACIVLLRKVRLQMLQWRQRSKIWELEGP